MFSWLVYNHGLDNSKDQNTFPSVNINTLLGILGHSLGVWQSVGQSSLQQWTPSFNNALKMCALKLELTLN